jgi:uncharacterized protein (DUF2225 family)
MKINYMEGKIMKYIACLDCFRRIELNQEDIKEKRKKAINKKFIIHEVVCPYCNTTNIIRIPGIKTNKIIGLAIKNDG